MDSANMQSNNFCQDMCTRSAAHTAVCISVCLSYLAISQRNHKCEGTDAKKYSTINRYVLVIRFVNVRAGQNIWKHS